MRSNPTPTRPNRVRPRRTGRGLRAWRALKEAHRTKEARKVPAALTMRAKQEGRRNDKECLLTFRESDWSIVVKGKAKAPTLMKGPTEQRSLHRQPVPYERRSKTGQPSC